MIIPYLPSTAYYRRLAAGKSPVSEPLNRALLSTDMVLTVPVRGGARALKRLPPEKIEIAQHGRWQHVHLGALEARLGRTPFWRHLEPEISPLIGEAAGFLIGFNRSLHEALTRFLDLETLLPELREMGRLYPERLQKVATGVLKNTNPEECFLNLAARFGRDAIFALAPTFI